MAIDCNEHVVWITGGGSGIGKALAKEFLDRGAKVAISGRRLEKLQETAAELSSDSQSVLSVVCDVTDSEAVKKSVAEVVGHFGKLDIVVANAGFGVAGKFEKISPEQWKGQFDTNVLGVVHTLQAALPEIEKTNGRLAVVSSVMGKIAMSKSSPYVSSKFALVGLCRSLQLELHGSGVTLTNLLPGLVSSEINQVDNNGVFHPDREDRRPSKLMWRADKAAKVMATAIMRRKREYTFTGHGVFLASLGQHTPGLLHWAMTRFVKVERP
ncbi:MAG: SDR family NAD(P)-dependent oxidoreductase [Deltaproteobacteria bacterium]|jgi:NAD(P)-dependent dehydrogenase (short-subunit alcohol dehydrogenase family)|nr:SDR family NAD(P)-dependent oxidoreductase [Deltaproteobacteria bacterium]MBT6431965.1 SDR family NAD(P)-dependent oxidoreductase [Deltaproteobacteria bacterium]MBT6490557.1 SDR family NAD(P)-dependent oxidoreductase [Deltaproteobacteria bacterium]